MQKYRFGDLVMRIKKDGTKEQTANSIILYSDLQCNNNPIDEDRNYYYALYTKSIGRHAWYSERQLELVKEKQEHLIEEWKKEYK